MARVWMILAVVVLLATGTVNAQSARGTVQGRVVDATGSVIAGATVAVTDDATGFHSETKSDDHGRYVVGTLDPAAYRLEVSQTGFRRHAQPFTLRVGQDLRLDVTLQTGPISETVTVSASAAQLERIGTSMATRFDPNRIANLPLDGRNFLDLALLTAGSVPPAQGSAGSVRGDFTFNVNGGREDANAYVLDGAYNFDPKLNTVGVRPPVDAIREFEVVGSTPDASYGKNAAAQINIVTKSGTNRLSATAYEFLRTGLFGARNYFAPENEDAPDYVRNQYGGSIGGAIKPNRLFFFADYEGTRLDEGLTRVTTVPTLAERVGDFSASAFPKPINPQTGQPFQNNQIPSQMLNQIGLAIAGLYPRPNRPGPTGNFVSSPSQVDHVDQFDLRADYTGQNYRIMSRYSFSDRRLFEPFAGPQFAAVPGFGNDVPRNAQNFVIGDTRTFGARFVNEARFSYSRIAQSVLHEGREDDLNSQVGLPNLSPNERDWGLSFITVANYSSLGDEYNNPQDSTANLWQVSDTLSWTENRHVLKAGLEFRGIAQDAFRDVQSRGLLQFTNVAFTQNALADLLIGLPTVTVGAAVDNPQQLRTHSFAMFLQDSYQFSPTVTFTAGLRYEYNAPPVDADDRVTLYDPATGSIVPVGTAGMPRAGYEADGNNLAPRLGAAWSVRPDTVVRAGYGIAYDQSALAPNEFLYFNAPYFNLNTYFSVPQANYFLTLYDPFPANFPVPLPESATAVQRDLKTAYLHQWNINVQHELGDYRTIEVAWVASRGRNLLTARDLNQPAPSPNVPNLRPNPLFADITYLESRGRSSYNALQLRMDQRLYRAVAFSAAYTLGKSMDDASGFFASAGDANFPQDSNNPEAEWARSNFDIRHRFTLSGLYEIPYGDNRRWDTDGLLATVFGNWDVNGIITLQSGAPFTVAIHPDIDNSNTGRANLGFGSNDRPDQVGDPDAVDQSAAHWFNTAAYAFPPFGTFGDVGRNSLEGPGYKNLNLALSRNIALAPGTLQLRLEFFNLFNWTNFGLPDNFLGSPTFGQILSAGAPRRFQIGIKFLYLTARLSIVG